MLTSDMVFDQIIAADTAAFLFINKTLANPVLNIILGAITNIGSLAFWTAVGFVALAKKQKKLAVRMLFAFAINVIFLTLLKDFIARPRPSQALEGVNVIDAESNAGFPSGHASNVFLGTTLLVGIYKKFAAALYALAIVVALSRIYVGAHYPTDVIAGSLEGVVLGLLILRWKFLEKVQARLQESWDRFKKKMLKLKLVSKNEVCFG